jgi:1-acyl-sn-glycerol-3-phosphate acyltransferase
MPSRLMQWLHGEHGPQHGVDPGEFDASAVVDTVSKLGSLFAEGDSRGYFRCSYDGFENIPDEPVMVVMNHSGGTTIPDVWGFLAHWYRRFGSDRPIHAMGHDMVFSLDKVGGFFAKRGVLRASRTSCLRALMGYKRDVLVLPGGDREVWRPYSKRFDCDFSGRTGYVRMAMEAGARIVPVAHAGAHETLMVLSDGHEFARKIGLHRIARAEIFPVHLSLPWGLAVGPWPHIPLPAALRYRVAEPIETRWDGFGFERTESSERAWVNEVDSRVRASIQRGLDRFAGRPEASAGPTANEAAVATTDDAHVQAAVRKHSGART